MMAIGDIEDNKVQLRDASAEDHPLLPCNDGMDKRMIDDCIDAFLFTPRTRAERAEAFLADWMRRFSRA